MSATITQLPLNFVGKEDAPRLECFGAYLIEHGAATRWRWQKSDGIDVAFLIYRGVPHDRLLVRIERSTRDGVYRANSSLGEHRIEGSLEEVMSAVDTLLSFGLPDHSA